MDTELQKAQARAVIRSQAYVEVTRTEIMQHIERLEYHQMRVEKHDMRVRLCLHGSVLVFGLFVAMFVACPVVLLPVVSGGPAILIEMFDRMFKI